MREPRQILQKAVQHTRHNAKPKGYQKQQYADVSHCYAIIGAPIWPLAIWRTVFFIYAATFSYFDKTCWVKNRYMVDAQYESRWSLM